TNTDNGVAIQGTSIYTATAATANAKIDIYTPVLDILSGSVAVSFDYRLTDNLVGQATRTVQVTLVNTAGTIVATNSITLTGGMGTEVYHYANNFTSITSGTYRIV